MTYRVIHQARWTCDGDCGATVIGWDDEVPADWKRRIARREWDHAEPEFKYYCPACTPPRAKP